MKVALPPRRQARVEMIPLIDTFFLLLAFFISSVMSMSVLGGIPVELPQVAAAVKLDPQEMAIVTVTREGAVELDGVLIGMEELAGRLRSDPRADRLRVAVRADRQVLVERLLEVMSVVRESGIRRVGLLTVPHRMEEVAVP